MIAEREQPDTRGSALEAPEPSANQFGIGRAAIGVCDVQFDPHQNAIFAACAFEIAPLNDA